MRRTLDPARIQKQSEAIQRPPANLLQRKCACGRHTAGGGECAECRKREEDSARLQTRLRVGDASDPLEREADEVAERVLRSAGPIQALAPSPEMARRASATPGMAVRPQLGPATEQKIQALRGGGEPLPEPVRELFEPRFGHDFSRVRLHTGGTAESVASSLNALAFTMGDDIVFGAGQYAPGTETGKRLLAHELTHVVQQGRSEPKPLRKPDPHGSAPERVDISKVGTLRIDRKVDAAQAIDKLEPGQKPRDLPPERAAEIGREALRRVGYERLLEMARRAGLLSHGSGTATGATIRRYLRAPEGVVLRQGFAEVFTPFAYAAGVASQVDSPAPGPGDAVALGILAVGLVVAGVAVLSASSTSRSSTTTVSQTLTRTLRRIRPNRDCETMRTLCLLTSLADLPGSVFGQSRCGWCYEGCVREGGVWPSRVASTEGFKRCDFWNFRSTE